MSISTPSSPPPRPLKLVFNSPPPPPPLAPNPIVINNNSSSIIPRKADIYKSLNTTLHRKHQINNYLSLTNYLNYLGKDLTFTPDKMSLIITKVKQIQCLNHRWIDLQNIAKTNTNVQVIKQLFEEFNRALDTTDEFSNEILVGKEEFLVQEMGEEKQIKMFGMRFIYRQILKKTLEVVRSLQNGMVKLLSRYLRESYSLNHSFDNKMTIQVEDLLQWIQIVRFNPQEYSIETKKVVEDVYENLGEINGVKEWILRYWGKVIKYPYMQQSIIELKSLLEINGLFDRDLILY